MKLFVSPTRQRVKKQLAEQGYHGLVNRKTSASPVSQSTFIDGFIEGTPIVLVKKSKRK